MITISNMSVLENSIAFAGHHTAFSLQCVNRSAACGMLFSARIDGKYAGYLCVAAESGSIRVLYAYTLPELRKQGVFTELMRFVAEKSNVPVRVNITENQEFHDVVRDVCLKLGYEQTESVRIFTCHKDMYPVWERFMKEKGDRLAAYLGRRGYEAVSFAEAPADIIDQLRAFGSRIVGGLCFLSSAARSASCKKRERERHHNTQHDNQQLLHFCLSFDFLLSGL